MVSRRRITSVVVAALLASSVMVQDAFSQRRIFRRPAVPTRTTAPIVRAPAGAGNVSSKALLQKVPDDVRMRFLESLVFKNGGLAGARIDEVKASLGTSQFQALMASCGCNGWHENWTCTVTQGCIPQKGFMCNPDKCAGNQGSGLVFGAGSVFYQALSAPERKNFLDSLDFVNGHLVGAYVGDVQQKLSGPEFDKALLAMGAQPAVVRSKVQDGMYRAGPVGVAHPGGAATEPTVRDHRTQPEVRDHRTQPEVRDHR
jgi:hypothetical protein